MKKMLLSAAMTAAMLTAVNMPALAEKTLPAPGDVLEGFRVSEISRFEPIGADVVLLEHEKTGAQVMLLENDDTNRVFEITFRTPTLDDTGKPHVFEHSTLNGSEKYPSSSLFMNLIYQTYNTYMNAATYNFMTTYPVASLSEAQLLSLTDFYVDSCFHPMLMKDPTIFDQEAWRYSLTGVDEPLTITGTVYSEMGGAITLESMAYNNFRKTFLPRSTTGNVHGGLQSDIPDLTWEGVCDYHEAYYHPSNSLSCLYGNIEDYPAFLRLLDGYFSAYEAKDIVVEDSAYTPINGHVEATFDFPLEAGANTANAGAVFYGIRCPEASKEDCGKLDLLTTLLTDSASPMAQRMREVFPAGKFQCFADSQPETIVAFCLYGANPEDAALFRETVDAMLAQTAQDGFADEAVDAISASVRMSNMLTGEQSNLGVQIIPNIASYWAVEGDVYGYMKNMELVEQLMTYQQEGAYQDVISRLLIGAENTAVVSTMPAPGLKEEQNAALAAHLAEVKAGMTQEELEALVASTAALANPVEDDASMYVAQLQAVTVDSLPEETRIYDIADEKENGIRYVSAKANVTGVSRDMLLLNAENMTTRQLLTFKLYTDLLSDMDTTAHDRSELASLCNRYLYNGTIRISLLESNDEDGVAPHLRMAFTALDEDIEAGYELLYEMLFDTDFTDVQQLADNVALLKTNLRRSITNGIYEAALYYAMGSGDSVNAAYAYTNYFAYYDYLCEVEAMLATDPAAVVADLQTVQAMLANRTAAIVCCAGNDESIALSRAAADAFLARLGDAPVVPRMHEFPVPSAFEAIVIDSAVQYNLVYATYEQMGLTEYTGAMDAVTALVTDMYLTPLLRNQYGVYSIFHGAADSGIYIETFRDPNVAETFELYDLLPQLIAETDVDQEMLNNYILSCYSGFAAGSGELTGAESAILKHLENKKQEDTLTYMSQLKNLTAEEFSTYAEKYAGLMQNGLRITSGGMSAISGYADHYLTVIDPFGAANAVTPADLLEETPYASASAFCRSMGLMEAMSDEVFGVNEPATLGEIAEVMYMLVGGQGSVEESMAFWNGYGVITEGEPADLLTREAFSALSCRFLAALGNPVEAIAPEGFADSAEVDEALAGDFGFMVAAGLMLPTDEGMLMPKAMLTRGEFAYLIMALAGG